MGSIGTLLTGKTYAQSEPDIRLALRTAKSKRGIAANTLTQGIPCDFGGTLGAIYRPAVSRITG
jgi:hypothetical protein